MELTDAQKEAVRNWVAEGQSLARIQTALREEYDLQMTYMDVRFLVDDLGAEIPDKPEPQQAAPADLGAAGAGKPPGEEAAIPFPGAEEPAPMAEEAPTPGPSLGGGSVSVTVDDVARPGAIVGGQVTFSDGVKATWAINQMGQLALDAGQPGYRPPESDIGEFQNQLDAELRKKGF